MKPKLNGNIGRKHSIKILSLVQVKDLVLFLIGKRLDFFSVVFTFLFFLATINENLIANANAN